MTEVKYECVHCDRVFDHLPSYQQHWLQCSSTIGKNIFLTMGFKNEKHMIKLASLDVDEIHRKAAQKFGVSNFEFCNVHLSTIEHQDVVEYINQYIQTDSKFVLYIKDSCEQTETSSEYVECYSVKVLESPLHCDPIPSYENLELKENLELFLQAEHKLILESFKQNNKLSNFERIDLSKSIVKKMLNDTTRTLKPDELERISKNLCEILKGELPVTFYKRYSKGVPASGKLHDAYNNLRHKMAAAGLIAVKHKARKSVSEKATYNIPPSTTKNDLLYDLQLNPFHKNIEEKWRDSYLQRKHLIYSDLSTAAYLKKFPALEQADGYKLIQLDFFEEYKKRLVLEIPTEFRNAIEEEARRKRKFDSEMFNFIDNEVDEKAKAAVSLMLLPYVFPCTNKRASSGTKRPSHMQISEKFIVHYKTWAEADSEHSDYLDKCNSANTEAHPRIYLIGSPVFGGQVNVGHIVYKFDTPGEAISSCMEIYLGLNIAYPKESERIFYFLQKYIFKVTTPNDKVDRVLATFANDYKISDK